MSHPIPRGRPKGATNKPRPLVVAVPPACPVESCRSTEYRVLRIASQQEIAGVLPHGQPYTRIVWRRVVCAACGQHYMLRSYECAPAEEPPAAVEGPE